VVQGPAQGELLLLSWGGTYGSVRTAAEKLRADGKSVAHAHLRWMNPMPKNLGAILKSYKKVVVPEVNDGQLASVIRMRYPGVDPIQFNRINGKPIKVAELASFVLEQL
jgi:2-oxoglutarate ferredoxin oxidoreductase subunit alpha